MRSRGFTLIELIVVVAVISLLLGLSISALRASRERARAAVCASNVRQLLLGLSSYEIENGRFPPGFEMPDPRMTSLGHYAGFAGTLDLAGWWWFDRSQEVNHLTLDGLDVLTCPSKRQSDPKLAVDILCGNYGANLSICRVTNYLKPYKSGFYGAPLPLAQIRRPAETLLLVDSGYSLISWWHVTEEPPVDIPSEVLTMGGMQHAAYVPGMGINRDKSLWRGQSEDAIGGRHPGKTVNVGFADGSVATKKNADDLMIQKIGDQLWSSSPLWRPGRDPVTTVTAVTPLPIAP
jgi:prepilin-type N-terminal cleavage/methylation domain-containing protein/prepilin-type processing-associated H-X9-DG protein